MQRQPGASAPESLVAFLAPKHFLLVIDNCEHVAAGVRSVVDAVLRACPRVTVLATSRTSLGIAVSGSGRSPRSGSPPPTTLLPPTSSPLCRCSSTGPMLSDPTWSATGENLSRVVELCRRLDGLPLAIELAAARVRSLNPADLVDRAAQPFDLLTGIGAAASGRHGTMRSVLDWSHDLLGPQQRLLFERLAVFAGGCTLTAVEDVCAGRPGRRDVAHRLTDLVDASLVTTGPTTGETRYSLLETMRQYGLQRLARAATWR